MRALTLTQPWAGLVASGIKLVENRPRRMIKAADFGQRFAIHASREIHEDVYRRIMDLDDGVNTVTKLDYSDGMIVQVIPIDARWYQLSRITSAVIAVATLDSCLDSLVHGIMPHEPLAAAPLPIEQRRWFFGPIGYVLRDVVALPTPVPCAGKLGFWTLPPTIESSVQAQLHDARTP